MFKVICALLLNGLAHYTIRNRIEYILLLLRLKPPPKTFEAHAITPISYKIYVVSMEESKDRRLFMYENMAKQRIDFEFIKAEIGKLYSNDETIISQRSNHYLTSGSVGCWLSHYKTWHEISQQRLEFAVVLEDDVIIAENFEFQIKSLLELAPHSFDIILLNTGNNYPHNRRAIVNGIFFSPYQIRNGMFGYILTPKGAIRLMNKVPHVKVTRGGVDSAVGSLIRNKSITAYHLIYPICWVEYKFGSATKE